MKEKKNELEDLIRLSHVVAKPYYIAVWFLAILLLFSVGANIYLASRTNEVTLDAIADNHSMIEQNNVR